MLKKKLLLLVAICSLFLTACANGKGWLYLNKLEILDEQVVKQEKMTSYFLGDIQYMDNETIINTLKENDVHSITIPIAWSEVEPQSGVFTFEKYKDVMDLYTENGFNFIIILDTTERILCNNEGGAVVNEDGSIKTSFPSHVSEELSDEKMVNFSNEKLYGFDYIFGKHNERIEAFYNETLDFLNHNYKNNVIAVSPGIMSEFEVKYPQSDYKWTSYSAEFNRLFVEYLSEQYSDISHLNKALNVEYHNFEEIKLPKIDYNNSIETSSVTDDPLFVDFMEFRENQLVKYLTPYIDNIRNHGFETIGYFAQFYHPQDAIYATHIINKCVDLYDRIVVDFNFHDGYKESFDSMVPAFLTNYAKNAGYKKVYTGLYVEKIDFEKNLDFLQECLDKISNDGNSDGIEIGNVMPITKLPTISLDYYKNSLTKNDVKIGMYFSKWNTYKTHGESETNINYFTSSFTNMLDIVQNKLGYSVDVISDDGILNRIDEYDLIIIPAQIIVAKEVEDKLSDYVENNHGKVLIDYRFAEFDAYGNSNDTSSLFNQNVKGSQGLNEEVTISNGEFSSVKIVKNDNNLPNIYFTDLADKGSSLFSDGSGNFIGMREENFVVLGFQPQNLFFAYEDDVYVEVLDYYIEQLLK